MQRVSVVGNSGSGKSTLARRIAAALDAPHVELDAINHQPGWVQLDPTEFERRVHQHAAEATWVIDGNYHRATEVATWPRADTVVWLRLPRRLVMRQIVPRTLKRAITREVLWNGNREPLSNFTKWDPEKNVMRWAWTQYDKYDERYEAAQRDPRFAHLEWVVLTSHAAADAWLERVAESRSAFRQGRSQGGVTPS